MKMAYSSSLLISEPPLVVIPSLAVALKSSDKAIILQQIHYWLLRSSNFIDGHKWVYNSVHDWNKQFPWLTEKALQRYLRSLEDMGLLVTAMPLPVLDAAKAVTGSILTIRTIASNRDKNRPLFIVFLLI